MVGNSAAAAATYTKVKPVEKLVDRGAKRGWWSKKRIYPTGQEDYRGGNPDCCQGGDYGCSNSDPCSRAPTPTGSFGGAGRIVGRGGPLFNFLIMSWSVKVAQLLGESLAQDPAGWLGCYWMVVTCL
ncbi:hypothetical protein BSKO_05265 [Bryopsis sp. KO-2023]|nr:hypothetical protein BSKO_05265 [Bryopsis sp. KO-2023]